MNLKDLVGADWGKIDTYALSMLEDESKPPFSYQGSKEGWIQLMVEESRFSNRSIPFLFQLRDIHLWLTEDVPGLKVTSSIGNIFTGIGTFESLLALAKDPNVLRVSASRAGVIEE
jgi:hypothetical protein